MRNHNNRRRARAPGSSEVIPTEGTRMVLGDNAPLSVILTQAVRKTNDRTATIPTVRPPLFVTDHGVYIFFAGNGLFPLYVDITASEDCPLPPFDTMTEPPQVTVCSYDVSGPEPDASVTAAEAVDSSLWSLTTCTALGPRSLVLKLSFRKAVGATRFFFIKTVFRTETMTVTAVSSLFKLATKPRKIIVDNFNMNGWPVAQIRDHVQEFSRWDLLNGPQECAVDEAELMNIVSPACECREDPDSLPCHAARTPNRFGLVFGTPSRCLAFYSKRFDILAAHNITLHLVPKRPCKMRAPNALQHVPAVYFAASSGRITPPPAPLASSPPGGSGGLQLAPTAIPLPPMLATHTSYLAMRHAAAMVAATNMSPILVPTSTTTIPATVHTIASTCVSAGTMSSALKASVLQRMADADGFWALSDEEEAEDEYHSASRSTNASSESGEASIAVTPQVAPGISSGSMMNQPPVLMSRAFPHSMAYAPGGSTFTSSATGSSSLPVVTCTATSMTSAFGGQSTTSLTSTAIPLPADLLDIDPQTFDLPELLDDTATPLLDNDLFSEEDYEDAALAMPAPAMRLLSQSSASAQAQYAHTPISTAASHLYNFPDSDAMHSNHTTPSSVMHLNPAGHRVALSMSSMSMATAESCMSPFGHCSGMPQKRRAEWGSPGTEKCARARTCSDFSSDTLDLSAWTASAPRASSREPYAPVAL